MNLKDARKLRDRIRASGLHCTVPTGFAPDGYFAKIYTLCGWRSFYSEREWVGYRVGSLRRRIKMHREIERPKHRSPLDILIDRACGINPLSDTSQENVK